MNKLNWKYNKGVRSLVGRIRVYAIVRNWDNTYGLSFDDYGTITEITTKRLKTAKAIAEIIEGEK